MSNTYSGILVAQLVDSERTGDAEGPRAELAFDCQDMWRYNWPMTASSLCDLVMPNAPLLSAHFLKMLEELVSQPNFNCTSSGCIYLILPHVLVAS
jgi:hypothetical protein